MRGKNVQEEKATVNEGEKKEGKERKSIRIGEKEDSEREGKWEEKEESKDGGQKEKGEYD